MNLAGQNNQREVMFSVLVACHNGEETLRLCVKSVLAGLGPQDEVLVCLDACTDDSESVLKEISDTRLRVFSSSTKLGRDGARNLLIERAGGKYLSILDADDFSFPWRFVIARRLLRKYDGVFGTAVAFGDGVRPYLFLPQVPRRIFPARMSLELLVRNPLVHSTCSVRREFFDIVGGYLGEEGEDYLLWLRASARGLKLFRGAIPVSGYRIHATQASQSKGFEGRVASSGQIHIAKAELAATSSKVKGWPECSQALWADLAKSSPLARLEFRGLVSWMKPSGLKRPMA